MPLVAFPLWTLLDTLGWSRPDGWWNAPGVVLSTAALLGAGYLART